MINAVQVRGLSRNCCGKFLDVGVGSGVLERVEVLLYLVLENDAASGGVGRDRDIVGGRLIDGRIGSVTVCLARYVSFYRRKGGADFHVQTAPRICQGVVTAGEGDQQVEVLPSLRLKKVGGQHGDSGQFDARRVAKQIFVM